MPYRIGDINGADLFREITVVIRVSPITALRQRVGLLVMKLGVILAGFGVRVEEEE